MENIKSVIANNIETLHKLDLEYNIVMHKRMLMEHQRDIKILTNAEGKRKLEEAFKKEYEETVGMGKTVQEVIQENKSIKLTNPYSNLPPTSYNLQSLPKKRNSNYTKPKKKRKKK
jgi:hypothetical protein